MTSKNISRFAWHCANLVAWGEKHELLADIIIAVLLTVIFAVLFGLALSHDAIWYDGLTEAQRYAAGSF